MAGFEAAAYQASNSSKAQWGRSSQPGTGIFEGPLLSRHRCHLLGTHLSEVSLSSHVWKESLSVTHQASYTAHCQGRFKQSHSW